MKRFTMILMCLGVGTLMSFQQLSAQSPAENKLDNIFGGGGDRLKLGFSIGIDHGYLGSFESDNLLLADNEVGYRMGILATIFLSQRFSLAPKVELNAQTSRLDAYINDMNTNSLNILPVNVQLMPLLQWRPRKRSQALYMIGGPNIKIPIDDRSQYGSAYFSAGMDIAADLGAGIEIDFRKLKVSPEIRYSRGFRSHNAPFINGGVRFHQAVFSLNFTH